MRSSAQRNYSAIGGQGEVEARINITLEDDALIRINPPLAWALAYDVDGYEAKLCFYASPPFDATHFLLVLHLFSFIQVLSYFAYGSDPGSPWLSIGLRSHENRSIHPFSQPQGVRAQWSQPGSVPQS